MLTSAIRIFTGSVLLFCMLFMLHGCGYRFAADSGNRLAAGQTAWVEFPRNETLSMTAQTVLKRAIHEELHALRGIIPAGDPASARYRIDGAVQSYSTGAISYTALDQVREYRAYVTADFEVFEKGSSTSLWKGTLSATKDYPMNSDLFIQRQAEEEALLAASRDIAQRLVVSVEQKY